MKIRRPALAPLLLMTSALLIAGCGQPEVDEVQPCIAEYYSDDRVESLSGEWGAKSRISVVDEVDEGGITIYEYSTSSSAVLGVRRYNRRYSDSPLERHGRYAVSEKMDPTESEDDKAILDCIGSD